MLKIAVLSDIHLEARPYGLEEKQEDIYKTFLKSLQLIKENNPDLIVIAGDLFDVKKVSYKSFLYASLLKNFSEKIFFVAGNHDPGISLFFKGIGVKDSSIRAIRDNLFIAKIDYCHNHRELKQKIEKLKEEINPAQTILVLHANLKELMPYLREKSKFISIKDLKPFLFSIVGHFHNSFILENKILIPGSIERLDITNIPERKIFFLEIDNSNKISIKPFIIPTRKILKTDSKEEVINTIKKENKYAPIVFYTGKVEDIKPEELLYIESKCLMFRFRKEIEDTIDQITNNQIEISRDNLLQTIENFFDNYKIDDELKSIFLKHWPDINNAEKELVTKFLEDV